MDTWSFAKDGFDRRDAAADGNRFLSANGYMGLRGMPEEADKSLFPALTLAGVYDRYQDRWREPVNAPNCLYIRLFFNGQPMALGETEPVSHRTRIDYRYGIYRRDTRFAPVRVQSERYVSMADCHLLSDRYSAQALEAGEVTLQVGISDDIWDINGPHLFDFRFRADEALTACAVTGQKNITVAVSQCVRTDGGGTVSESDGPSGVFRTYSRKLSRGESWTICLAAAVYTSLDGPDAEKRAKEAALSAASAGYEQCLSAHQAAWDRIWRQCEMILEGDEQAALYLHASQYHLNCVAPRHAADMSIPARGLSGQTYKGAIFWDSEMFLFPMFVYTQPEIARSLLRYRIHTLPGALKKAREYGCRGAFYAWESQEGGEEGCTNFNVVDVFTHRPVRTYFRDKQIHISSDIVYALRAFVEITGDRSLLEEGGAEVILECARFYLSRADAHVDRPEIDFSDVIGPDEYHERVRNNAFTNRMIRRCLETALELPGIFADRPEWFSALLNSLGYEKDWALLPDVLRRISAPSERDGVIEQFDGYFSLEDCPLSEVRSRLADPREYWGGDHGVAGVTQVIKQADVIAMMALFPEDYTDDQVARNWAYYEPRTEHGSSLSACMYALTACRLGLMDEAWTLFMKTAGIDVLGGGKQWAGEIYIGGTHPASNGGAWMIAALGFAGLQMTDGRPTLHPRLPRQISRLRFPIIADSKRMLVDVTHESAVIRPDC